MTGYSPHVDTPPPAQPTRQPIGPLRLAALNLPEATEWLIVTALSATAGVQVHLANAHTISLADRDAAYLATIEHAMPLVDGRPVAWASALLRQRPRLRQVRGPSLMEAVSDRGRAVRLRHYLLGGEPAVLTQLRDVLERRYPGILIVGAVSPPFRDATPAELAQRDADIASSGAQVVWVGLGTPKQDVETRRLADALPVVAVGIGAAFDFLAGRSRQAPRWMTRLGLEWVHRLMQEPRRLWRRYAIGNPQFVISVVRGAIRRG